MEPREVFGSVHYTANVDEVKAVEFGGLCPCPGQDCTGFDITVD